MAEDWLADVRKYASGADENVVGAIVKHLGIALRNRDSSLVSFSDPVEVGRVREGFLRKKLALTGSDDALNAGLDWVKGLMSGDRTKNRVTVYYLLAHYFGKLDLFGGAAGTSAASLVGSGTSSPGVATIAGLGVAGAALAGANDGTASAPPTPQAPQIPEPTAKPVPEPLTAVPSPGYARSAPREFSAVPPSSSGQPACAANLDEDSDERSGWPTWLTWLLLALAVVALFFLLKSCMAEEPVATGETAAIETTMPPVSEVNPGTQVAGDGAATAVPAGAGVVSGTRDSKPLLTVYFASGQSTVSNDLAAATANLKSYLDAHAGAKLAVSGYNDPSGNAALNAALSKKRAQGVAAALAAAGIPEGSVDLVKPDDTTSTSVTPEQARRVEVTIQ
ncbi:MAG: DUF2853 family protein [Betaproteobacteria bacterium]|jgi:outer membrane protein OmpA-like peptidoglycan-associated protein|nr:DUF2853 family protein [Betaproteobacteria bacterium]